jgi:hypothetical protein
LTLRTISLASIAALALASMTMSGVIVGGGASAPDAARATGRDTHINLVIDVECVTKPIILTDCDLTVSPAKCKSVTVTYRPACASIQVVAEQKERVR